MKKNLYKISEVARFLSITTTTLRYYESEGLLVPAYVDPQSKYRYYDVNNINTIAYILALRDAGVSMLQIKKYFSNQSSMATLLDEMIEKQKRMQSKIAFLKDMFDSAKQQNNVSEVIMPETKYISKHYIAKDFQDAFELVQQFLANAIRTTTLTASPITYIKYDSLEFASNNFPITIGIEVVSAKENIKVRPSQKAIRIMHHGSYETLPKAYELLLSYAEQNDIELVGTVYEYYHESLNLRLDSNDYVTEVIMPIN